jgi:hypothetical protein
VKYKTGEIVKVGDRVRLGEDESGLVVFCIDTDEYLAEYPKEQWSYLMTGVMINFQSYGLIHYVEDDEDLELVSRA